MAISSKTETESVRTEATPLRSSEDPSLVKAGLEYVLLFIFSSIFFIVEYQFCKQFMPTIHAIFEGKFIEKPNGYLLLRIWRKHLYKIFFLIFCFRGSSIFQRSHSQVLLLDHRLFRLCLCVQRQNATS